VLRRWDVRAYDVWLLMAALGRVLDLMEFDSKIRRKEYAKTRTLLRIMIYCLKIVVR
jgi:hypothetical protein